MYISAIANETNLSTKIIADAYFTDGTNETIVVKSIEDKAGAPVTIAVDQDNNTTTAKGWYSYSKNSKDEYTLEMAQTSAKLTANSIEQNKVLIANTVSGNKDTVFIVKDKNEDITVYTGISNVPDITNITAANSFYLRDKDESGKLASVVFVDATNGSVRNSNESLLYLLKLDSTSIDNTDNEKIYTWKVLLNGEETTIKSKVLNSSTLTGTLYDNYSIDADGYYEADDSDKFDTADADKFEYTMTGAAISNSGDTLTIKGNSYVTNGDTQINVIMAPPTKGTGTLSNVIMTDNAADYETMLNTKGSSLANKFKGYTVTGKYFVIYDDKSGSDLITDLYVVVTDVDAAPAGSATAISGTLSSVAGLASGTLETDDSLTQSVVVSGTEITVESGFTFTNSDDSTKVLGTTMQDWGMPADDDAAVVLRFDAPAGVTKNNSVTVSITGGSSNTGTMDGNYYIYLLLGYDKGTDTSKKVTLTWTADDGNTISETYTVILPNA